ACHFLSLPCMQNHSLPKRSVSFLSCSITTSDVFHATLSYSTSHWTTSNFLLKSAMSKSGPTDSDFCPNAVTERINRRKNNMDRFIGIFAVAKIPTFYHGRHIL